MGKNSRSRSSVSQAKHFVLGAGLVLVLATVLPALAQFGDQQTPGLPFNPGSVPDTSNIVKDVLPMQNVQPQQPQLQKGPLINVPDTSGILKDALKQAQQPQQPGEEEGTGTGIFPGKGATKGVFPGKGATLGKFPGRGTGVSGEPKGEEEGGQLDFGKIGKSAKDFKQQREDEGTGTGEKDFSGALKKADVFGKRGIAPLPFKKGKASQEGTEMIPSETPTEVPAVTEEGTTVTEPIKKGRPATERLDKLPGFSRGVGGREDATSEEGAPSPQLFDPKQYKQFVDKDLLKLFGKKPVKPAIQLPEIEEGGGLEEDAQVFGQYVERLIKAGRKLSKKSLRQNAIGFYSQVSKWCEDEEADCGDELNELKYAIRKGSKKDLLQTLSEKWQAIQEKVLSGGEEEEEEEFFEEEEF